MKKIIIFLIFLILISIFFFVYITQNNNKINNINNNNNYSYLNEIKESYNKYVKTNKVTELFKKDNNNFIKIGTVNENIILNLQEIEKLSSSDKYFKLKNLDYYIYYKNVEKIESFTVDKDYQNYVVFNENIITDDSTNFYNEEKLVYTINQSLELPIVIKETNRKYVVYDDQLLYIKDEDIKQIKNNFNTNEQISDGLRVMTYHKFYNQEKGDKCSSIICHEVATFDEQMKYLKDNEYYTVTMHALELFLDGKIRLPKKSVVITIDDGGNHIIKNAYPILEKYNIHATLFLITSRYTKTDYEAPFIEIHSHSHDLHNSGVCPEGQGSPIKCSDKNYLLEDLAKSRQILNNTTIFGYPFYEYNAYAIKVLKEAGFKMAFANVGYKIKPGDDKMTLSRYTVLSTTTFNEYINMVK